MKEFDELVTIIKRLRSPQGCPWDRAQKVSYYKKYLLEETYELIEAIHKKNRKAVREELGDVFLILVAITQMYSERKVFSIKDVLKEVNYKLISRHPHVFSSKKLKSKEAVLDYWILQKAKKKKRKTIKDRLPLTAPALLLADILCKEAYRKAHKNKNEEEALSLARIKNCLTDFKTKRNKASLLEEVVLETAKLAFLYHLDLESLLRMKVLKKASTIAYGKEKIGG